MNDLVEIKCGKIVVSSKKVADKFGKKHREVLKTIRALECSDEFREVNFTLTSYTSSQNKVLPCYEISRDGFAFLCMGFTGKEAATWKEAYINAFNAMEHSIKTTDSEINRLTIAGKDIKKAGQEWSKFGRDVNKRKKENDAEVKALIADVQLKLGI